MTTSEHSIDGLEAVDATVGIVDGRVAMSADGDAAVRVDTPDHQPLSRIETHATLRVAGTDYRARLDLNASQRDALAGELFDAERDTDDGAGVTATDAFVFDCRSCSFIGEWLTTRGTCPECNSRDVATRPRGDDR